MTIDQLMTLEMIVLKGSFKAAAEFLNKTQPSLSVAIKKLEEEFSLTLFDRSEYRPSLTSQGKVFYRWAQESLKSFRELQARAQEIGQQAFETTLNIHLDQLVNPDILEEVFKLPKEIPLVTDFSISSGTLNSGLDKILNQEVDFAVAPKTRHHEDIESLPFDEITLLAVCAKTLLRSDKATSSWLKSNRQIIVKDAAETPIENTSGPKCYVSNHQLKKHLILGGMGWGRLARHEITAELKNGLLVPIKEDLAPAYHLKLHIMRSRLKPLGPMAKIIWNNFLTCATDEPKKYKKTKKSNRQPKTI